MSTGWIVILVLVGVLAIFGAGFLVGMKYKERTLFTKAVLKDTVDKLSSGKGGASNG